MKLATATVIVAALIAGSAFLSTPRSRRAFTRLPALVGATARLVVVGLVPLSPESLQAAAQDFVSLQVNARHRIVTTPALSGSQLPVHTHRQTWWR